MELNYVVDEIELLGTTVRELSVENSIVDVEKDSKRNFGMSIMNLSFKKQKRVYSDRLVFISKWR